MTESAEERLIQAATELSEAGWGRAKMYEYIRENMPSSDWDKMQTAASIRHLNIFIGLLSGEAIADLKQRYEVNTLRRIPAMYSGRKVIYRTIGIKVSGDDERANCECHSAWWRAHAENALQKLRTRT